MLGWIATLTLALSLSPAPAPTAARPDEPPPAQDRPHVYDETADGAAQIAAALEVAARKHQRVLVQWGANWCGWCIKLHGTLKSEPQLSREVLYEYQVVHVDIGQWDKHMDLAQRYGADLKGNGVPYWTILDEQGKVVANEATGPLEKDGAHDPDKVLAVLKRSEAPREDASELLDAALAGARAHGRRLWLAFGAPWCGWCHRLEGWALSPEVAPLLARDFDFVEIDIERTTGGEELAARFRGNEPTGIPWWAFLEPDGTVLADSGKGRDNLGCPWSDPELERFTDILKQVRKHLDDEAVATLVGTLRAERQRQEEQARRERENPGK